MGNRFILRAQKEIVRKLATILVEVKDPRLTGRFAISRVKLSPDLSHLQCWFVINEPLEKQEEILDALKHALPFLRRRLGESIHLRKTPALKIFHDRTPEDADRIHCILEELHERGDLSDLPVGEANDAEEVDDGEDE